MTTGALGSPTPAQQDEAGSAAQRERRTRMLDATVALAREGGFDAVQMRAVAERADVALGTLYRYFPSKIHLLVSALGREFARADEAWATRAIPGDTAADRVVHVLRHMAGTLQQDGHLAEALTRAFVFADGSVREESHQVALTLTHLLTRAMHAGGPDAGARPGDDDDAIARVIGDVWLSAVVAWVTGRSTDAETTDHMERAVRLLLR